MATAARQESNLHLETSFVDTLAYVAGAVVFMMTGLVFSFLGYKIGWLIGIFPASALIYLIYKKLSCYSTLLLSPGGFTYKSQYKSFSFRWTDVERFWIGGTLISPVIVFSLSQATRAQINDPQYRLQSAYVEEGMTYFQESYGIGAKNLCAMLNEWRIRYTDRSNRVVVFG